MILVLLGAPGAGKGTQAAAIVNKYSIPNISTGDLLRAEVKQNTELGNEAKQYMNQGKLVPDKLIVAMIDKRVDADDCCDGFILDGFPRNVDQAQALKEVLGNKNKKLDVVVSVDVDTESIVQRLCNRLTCVKCKENFNRISMLPKVENVCDKCGGELAQREDDKEETIRNRLNVYEEQTKPLIEFFSNENKLYAVDGNRAVLDISTDILKYLENFEQ